MKIEDSLTTLSGILQSSIQDVLARASTYQFVLRMDCLKCGFEESKRQTGSARCQNQNVDVHLNCLQLARGKNVADTFTVLLWT